MTFRLGSIGPNSTSEYIRSPTSIVVRASRASRYSGIVAAPDVYRQQTHHSHYGNSPYSYIPQTPDLQFYPSYTAPYRSAGQDNRFRNQSDQHRPWSGARGQRDLREDYMSNRQGEQGPFERGTGESSHDPSRPIASPANIGDNPSRPGSSIRSLASPNAQSHVQHTSRPIELPPLPPITHTTSGSFPSPAGRIAGVSSFLNASQSEEAAASRPRKTPQLGSPRSSTQPLPPIATTLQGLHSSSIHASPASQHAEVGQAPARRILTPRSPSLHRAASLGQLHQSAGAISAQRNPFLGSPRGRAYAVEPGIAGAPPLPTPPAGIRHGYGFPDPAPSSAEPAHRTGTSALRTGALSSSASPSTSYSSYSQAGQTSPVPQYAPQPMATLSSAFTSRNDPSVGGPGTASAPPASSERDRQRHMGIPISSSGGPNVYQMMTINTEDGPMSLPVDVQAASRVADEKRRRNAGASARFRQRRKEKEKEASTSISRLEQQVKDLGEDAEFYRRERDALREALLQFPTGDRYFPRPISPRRRRPSISSLPGSSGRGSVEYGPAEEQSSRSPGEGRNVRRRTSTFSLHQPPSQLPMPAPTMAPPGYGPLPPQQSPAPHHGPPGPLPSPHGRSHLPALSPMPPHVAHQQPTGQQSPQPHAHQGPPSVMQALPQTGPYNPFAGHAQRRGPS